ncbi:MULTISPECIES: glutathione S-transferase family protein [Paraburkholderia]|jgi:glutathione S-transferase|uniref:Glutathione S-transferase n=1 Tax=Paraburkholderia phenazinium TaxID=60549 RepID=A0A1N6K019_9BURK|nr:glutathione S-transferase N-terminal domain-containing protein [Paraburkholderia phenazinium]SIO42639.1 Glutathione S-transferase [Paraburkholderia phenazinium]SIO49813.1 Glutathione S-transferase [Paraburkholderia phenazinium]
MRVRFRSRQGIMQLFATPASPWVRRVMICIIELGIQDKVTTIQTRWPHSWGTHTVPFTPEFGQATPVGRIPALVTDQGLSLADSMVICDYLNAEYGQYRLLPQAGERRWRILSQVAIANGILEAHISRRAELLRDPAGRSAAFLEKMKVRAQRCFVALNEDAVDFAPEPDLAQITIAAACGFSDFRYQGDQWRATSPHLAYWYENFSQRSSMVLTRPAETPQ